MALPALPASNTKRYFLLYVAGTKRHSIQMRVADSVTDGAAVTAANSFLDAVLPNAHTDVSYDGLEVAEKGSDVRNPVAGWTTRAGTGTGTTLAINESLAFSAVGRSPTGRKTKLEMYGMDLALNSIWRIDNGDDSGVGTIVGALNDFGSAFLAIDGSLPEWRDYLNFSYNDHWVDQARG